MACSESYMKPLPTSTLILFFEVNHFLWSVTMKTCSQSHSFASKFVTLNSACTNCYDTLIERKGQIHKHLIRSQQSPAYRFSFIHQQRLFSPIHFSSLSCFHRHRFQSIHRRIVRTGCNIQPPRLQSQL